MPAYSEAAGRHVGCPMLPAPWSRGRFERKVPGSTKAGRGRWSTSMAVPERALATLQTLILVPDHANNVI